MAVQISIHNVTGIRLEQIKQLVGAGGKPFWTRIILIERAKDECDALTLFAQSEDALYTPEEKRENELRDAEYRAHCESENALRNGRILGFNKGYVPMDVPPGFEEAAYERWKKAGGVVDADAAPAESPTGTTVAF